jgi:hypothetical protein
MCLDRCPNRCPDRLDDGVSMSSTKMAPTAADIFGTLAVSGGAV